MTICYKRLAFAILAIAAEGCASHPLRSQPRKMTPEVMTQKIENIEGEIYALDHKINELSNKLNILIK
jgi:hypothetical protein